MKRMRDWKTWASSFCSERKLWVLGLALAAGTFLVYAPTLSYPFLWDDEGLITQNPHIRSFFNIHKFFLQDLYWGAAGNVYYRPLQAVSNLLNYQVFGLMQWGYHLTNIFLHISVGLLLFLLFARLSGQVGVAFVAGFIWLLHPIHPEAVTYIAGRADSLSAIFVLLTVFFHWKMRETISNPKRRLFRLLACSVFFLAMLSKEISFVAIPLIWALDLWIQRRWKGKEMLASLGPYVLVFALYAMLRHLALPEFAEKVFSGSSETGHPLGLFFGFPLYLIRGFGLILFPRDLHMERLAPGMGPDGMSWALVSIILTLAGGYGAWRGRRRFPNVLWGMAFYVLTFLPFLLFLFRSRLYLEHWLYLPSFGVIFAGTALLARAGRGRFSERLLRNVRILVSVGVIILVSGLTVAQNRIWGDPVRLYEHVVSYSPWSARTHFNLALAYFKRGRWEEADQAYKILKQLQPDIKIEGGLGLLRAAQGRPEEALALYTEALRKEPAHTQVLNNRAALLASMGRLDEAISDLRKTVSLDPGYRDAWYNLGTSYLRKGDVGRAKTALERVTALGPSGEAAFFLAQIYLAEKRVGDALELLQKTIRTAPTANIMNLLGVIYAQTQNPDKAVQIWRQGLERYPQNVEMRENLKKMKELQKNSVKK